MGFLKEFLKLTRFEHALMLALAVLISEIIVLGGFPVFTIPIILSLLVPVLSEMGSFSLNDYLDIETDRLNKRLERPLVKGTLSPKFAFYFSWISFLLSIILSYYINFYAFTIVLVFNIFAILYNYKLKDLPLLGNIYIATTMAIPLIFGNFVISETLNPFILLLTILAFLSGLGREIIKSVQDMEGDKKARASKTYPLLVGKNNAIHTAAFIYLLFLFSIGYLLTLIQNLIALSLIGFVGLFYVWQITELIFGKKDQETLEFSRKYTLISLLIGMFAILIEIIF